jgi:tRNA C32,U32 (ribose-2'-O)-methylase TrmJ
LRNLGSLATAIAVVGNSGTVAVEVVNFRNPIIAAPLVMDSLENFVVVTAVEEAVHNFDIIVAISIQLGDSLQVEANTTIAKDNHRNRIHLESVKKMA